MPCMLCHLLGALKKDHHLCAGGNVACPLMPKVRGFPTPSRKATEQQAGNSEPSGSASSLQVACTVLCFFFISFSLSSSSSERGDKLYLRNK